MAFAQFLDMTMTITPDGGTLSEILGIQSVTLNAGSPNRIDITTAKDFITRVRTGLRDGGTINVSVLRSFRDVGQQALYAMWVAQPPKTGELVWTMPEIGGGSTSVVTMNVYVQSNPFTGTKGDVGKSSIVLKLNGAPVVPA